MSERAWSVTHADQAHPGRHPRGTDMTMTTRPSKTVLLWFWLWFALATLLAGFIAAGLRGKLTDGDRQAIEQMLDGALP